MIASSVAAGFGRHGMPPIASNPYLRPFDLETGIRVASRVENLPSKFGHARHLRSKIIRYIYVRDGRTDRQTKATLIVPFPTELDIITMKCTVKTLWTDVSALYTSSVVNYTHAYSALV